jgi:predicted HicB family RNase H-like nuclease
MSRQSVESPNNIMVSVAVPDVLRKAALRAAAARGQSLSAYARQAIADRIRQDSPAHPNP